ncbi:MAG: Tn3 family transposase [Tatlockia sp.]|nr:Tn3 family transposase [Tatlockia sp.]
MSSIEKTAYPRFPKRKKIKPAELHHSYSIQPDEINMINRTANKDKLRFNLAIQLKTFQRLGHFVEMSEIPSEIIIHIRQLLNYHHRLTPGYANNRSLYRHRQKIREFLNVKYWGYEDIDGNKIHLGMKLAIKCAYDASQLMNNISDIINVVIEKLVHASYELPSFYRLNLLVRHTRHSVNNKIFHETMKKTKDSNQSEVFHNLLKLQDGVQRTLFNKLKEIPKRPSINRFHDFLDHFQWLMSFGNILHCLDGIAKIKIEQFAEEAYQLSADEINECSEAKRYTLIASLIYRSQANGKDALAIMFCRLIAIAHRQSKLELESKLNHSKEDTCNIVELFKKILQDGESIKEYTEFVQAFYQKVKDGGGFPFLTQKCNDILASHGNEYRIYLIDLIQKRRSLLFKILKSLDLNSSTQDDKLIVAIKYLLNNENRRAEFITEDIDLSFATAFWNKQIMGVDKTKANRRAFESCVFEYVSKGLNSGDLYVKGARNYADYRAELLPWDDCLEHLDKFCEEVGIENNAKDMITNLQKLLIDKAQYVDQNYLNIPDFVINEDGRPVLKKYEPKQKSEHAEMIENLIRSRLPERNLLDILTNGHHYTGWADEFGPISGTEGKLENAIEKYILTNFCYGTGLGPTQTAKHVRFEIEPRTLSRVNKKHFTLNSLSKAIIRIINCLNEFPLLRTWGTGQRVGVDGTFEDIYDDNMVAEQHIRYGKKGGVAYRHIADNYIALFSTFIQCGVWEAIHIIDVLLKNASEVQPNIVHADTQGQSLPVFAFAYLFGIQLMPRIRNWKDLNLYRPDKKTTYRNIDSMFCDAEIDWDFLEMHWKDLMQVIISIKLGKVSSAFILSKLNSYNNQNKLYKAFQELGKVIRTIFLLDYVSDKELRQTITATTNKVESYHTLEDWIRFGSKYLVVSNDPDEMEKAVKHNDLIANCIMLQNVIDITDVCHDLIQEGYRIIAEDVSHMSPYMTDQFKRFGEYVLDLGHRPTNLEATRDKVLFEAQDEVEEESVA